jgi:hypothetical protein
MKYFKDWLKKVESFGGSYLSPSSAEEQGDGGDGLVRRLDLPGAFPTYELKKNVKKNSKNQKLKGIKI